MAEKANRILGILLAIAIVWAGISTVIAVNLAGAGSLFSDQQHTIDELRASRDIEREGKQRAEAELRTVNEAFGAGLDNNKLLAGNLARERLENQGLRNVIKELGADYQRLGEEIIQYKQRTDDRTKLTQNSIERSGRIGDSQEEIRRITGEVRKSGPITNP